MSRYPPVFGKVTISIVVLGMFIYIAVVEWTGFDLVGHRQSGYHAIAHRSREVMFVWPIACLAYGWALVLSRRMRSRTPNPLAVALVPVIIGVCLGVYNLWAYNVWAFGKYVGPPGGEVPWILLGIGSATWITGIGALLAYTLIIHGKIWRRLGLDRRCSKCEYDLTGNVSGVCPECGEPTQQMPVGKGRGNSARGTDGFA